MTKPDLKVVSRTPESDVAKAQRLRREAAEIETVILRGVLQATAAMTKAMTDAAEMASVPAGVQSELVYMAKDINQRLTTIEQIMARLS